MMNSEAVFQQLGGKQKVVNQLNVTQIDPQRNAMSFHFEGSEIANICIVRLTPSDEYELELIKLVDDVNNFSMRTVSETDAWAGNLKEVFEAEAEITIN